jgi:hypothetical protein
MCFLFFFFCCGWKVEKEAGTLLRKGESAFFCLWVAVCVVPGQKMHSVLDRFFS